MAIDLFAHYVNQLEVYDPTMHLPLMEVTYMRDIKLRGGISIADEAASFQRNVMGASGTTSETGIPWLSNGGIQLPGVSLGSTKVVTEIVPCGRAVMYNQIELEKSAKLGQPIDFEKAEIVRKSYQFSTDRFAYIGDANFPTPKTGLLNYGEVPSSLVDPSGTGATDADKRLWANKTQDQIRDDINEALKTAWDNTGNTVIPDTLLLSPSQFTILSSRISSTAADRNLLSYVKNFNLYTDQTGRELNIRSVKWLKGLGANNTDRFAVYLNDASYVRFPLAPIAGYGVTQKGIEFERPYLWAMGQVEVIYPETMLYADGA